MCASNNTVFFHNDKKRDYWQCTQCLLIFVLPQHHLTPSDEKSIYDLHINDPSDLGYRKFLQRFVTPLEQHILKLETRILAANTKQSTNLKGLDFGSGPGPTLSGMLETLQSVQQLNIHCENYDLYYAPHTNLLVNEGYDFVTSTEVVEHLREPLKTFELMFSLLKPDSCLGIMTKRTKENTPKDSFASWHYIQDPTHICFYNEKTFYWLAHYFDVQVSFPETDVAIFEKSSY